jgi:tetratricopeptide (TPR) repeat protein
VTDSPTKDRRFLVALSFPKEHRAYVREVANYLKETISEKQIFFDEWYEAELAQPDLDTYLQSIYAQDSHLVVPFFGENYNGRMWCARVEWRAIRSEVYLKPRDPRYLMAMRFDDADVDGFLPIDGYVSIRNRPPSAIGHLILQRLQFMGLYEFPAIQDGKAIPLIPHNLPFPSIANFLKGRDAKLEELESDTGTSAITQTQAIKGDGGIGKTQLAVEFGWRAVKKGTYTHVLFVIADSPEALQSNLAHLAIHPLGLIKQEDATNEKGVADLVIQWLESKQGWLLIFDNADNKKSAEAVQKLLPRLTNGRVIITARYGGWAPPVKVEELDILSPESAKEYLLEAAHHRTEDEDSDEEAINTLIQLTDGLPLILEQAAAYINCNSITFSEYVELWEESRVEVLNWKEGMKESIKPVAITYQRTFNRLSLGAQALLRLCAFLAPEPIPLFLIKDAKERLKEAINLLAEEDGEGEAILEESKISPLNLLGELAKYSLAKREKDVFTIHRLVQEAVRLSIPEDKPKFWVNCALNWINGSAPDDSNNVRTWTIWDPLRPHTEKLIKKGNALKILFPTSRLLRLLGLYYDKKDLYLLSEPLLRKALEIEEDTYGSNDPRVASILIDLIDLLWVTGRIEEAIRLAKRALGIDESSYEPNNPVIARDLNKLADLYLVKGLNSEAEIMIRRALAINESCYVDAHPSIADCLCNLAHVISIKDPHDLAIQTEAEEYIRRAIEINETFYSSSHPEVAIALSNLAAILLVQDRVDESESAINRALEIDKKSYGESSYYVSIRLSLLAFIHLKANRYKEAENCIRKSINITQNILGTDNPEYALKVCNLGTILCENGNLNDGLKFLKIAYDIYKNFDNSYYINKQRVASLIELYEKGT